MVRDGGRRQNRRPLSIASLFNLLLAEDNPINRKVAERMLARAGHTVTCVEDGAGALAQLAGQRFDAVLMDVYMPGMDGLEATRRIRAMGGVYTRLPVIALTGALADDEIAACRAAGMDDVVAKPVDGAELAATLARVIARRADAGPAPVLDFDVIGVLWDELGMDEIAELVEVFDRSGRSIVARLDAALAAGDTDQVHRAAHEMKSAAGGLGLKRLAVLCVELERAGREDRLEAARGQAEAFEPAFLTALGALHAFTSQAPGP